MNELITAIQQRNSSAKLAEPAPSQAELNEVFKAALRAPDHAALKPWRYLTISGEARKDFGTLLVAAKKETDDLSTEQAEKLASKALRAPLIIVPIVRLQDHPKVPEVEQWLSAGASTQNVLLSLSALGFGAIWRTGFAAFSDVVAKGLGLSDNEKMLGFIYTGTSTTEPKTIKALDLNDFVSVWSSKK